MRRRSILLLAGLMLAPPVAEAARRPSERLLQSTVTERGWVLEVDARRARVAAPDGVRKSFRVRRGERWLGLTELAGGWIAAGIRVRGDDLDLTLVADRGRGPRRMTPPGGALGGLRTAPTPLVDGERLVGLAWLEGDDVRRLSIRVAAYEGGVFDGPTTVSRPGAGSQSGLTAAVLRDGSWLLVWARYDGRDDDLYWSLKPPGGDWTTPRRLAPNNAVPDITPRLLPHGDGALLAWSRQGREYEVLTARFTGGRWTAPSALGIAGTVYPEFRRLDTADYLLVRNAWPAGWTALRLDEAGRPVDFAAVAEESGEAPLLRAAPGRGLAFEWPDRGEPATLTWEPLP